MTQQSCKMGNLDCPDCACAVETGVQRLVGVESAVVDFASNTMRVEGDIPYEDLRERVESLGKTISPPDTRRAFVIGNMDCAGCAREIETAVLQLDDVSFAEVDYLNAKLELIGPVPFERLRNQVEALGKSISPIDRAAVEFEPPHRGGVLGFWDFLRARQASRMAIYGGILLLTAIIVDLLTAATLEFKQLLYVLAMAVAMKPIAQSGINTLRINREFNINLLMTIAAIGALILGEFLEAATVIFLFAIGEALEGYTADRARDSLRGLVALKPLKANRIIDGGTELTPVEQLRAADEIRVLPGERIPMDGNVVAGSSAVNQAHITGESLPILKTNGDEVFAGSINGEAVLDVRVSRLSEDNTLSRIIAMLHEAQARRAPSQRLIDRFARIYTPTVALAAVAVAFIPPLFFGQPFWDGDGGAGWLYRALSMLVIACPCALVISTPVTVISAITAAARRGVLIKGGAHLEALAGIKTLAFDKTGTLTRGKLEVVATHTDNCNGEAPCDSCDDMIALAAAVEAQSTHPFAEAILAAARSQGLRPASATAVQNLAGLGMRGEVNGKRLTIGSHSYFENEFAHSARLCDKARLVESRGQSAVMVHDGEAVRGVIALADSARDESPRVVTELREMGISSVMLTGDNDTVARFVAARVGVEDFRAELLPGDKVDAVEDLRAQYGQVAMIGDGINDTPALAAASVGIAMGAAGSPQAMETADVVLMADKLDALPKTIRRARLARNLIRENIMLAFGLKAVFLLLALTGNVTMLAAVFADMGMSLAVTLNGMRALRE